MKKLFIICLIFTSLLACNDEKNNENNESMDTSLIDQSIVHQEEVDELNELIKTLNDDLSSKSTEAEVNFMKVLKDLDQAKSDLVDASKKLEDKNIEIENLLKEKSTWLDTSEASPQVMPNWNMSILNGNSNGFNYILEILEEEHAQRTYVLGEGEFLDLMRDEGPRPSISFGDGMEVSAFEVYGTVYNVTWAEIIWSDDFMTYEIGEVKESIEEVSDTSIYIHALLAESLPYQVVYFENSKGERISQTLSYDGYGISGNVLTFD